MMNIKLIFYVSLVLMICCMVLEQGSTVWWLLIFTSQGIILISAFVIRMLKLRVKDLHKIFLSIQITSVLCFFLLLMYCLSRWNTASNLWQAGIILAFCLPFFADFLLDHSAERKRYFKVDN